MPNRRDIIKMTEEEISSYLNLEHVMSIATILPSGFPHIVAMFYGFFKDGSLGFWTFAKSQKAKNLERNPKLACLVESGREYPELKGVQIIGEGQILRDDASLLEMGNSLIERYFAKHSGGAPMPLEAMARKRVAVKIIPKRITSWDHTKLGGLY